MGKLKDLHSGYSARIAGSAYVVGSFACIGGGLFGLDISNLSGIVSNPAYIQRFGNAVVDGSKVVTTGRQGGIIASMPAGSFAGALLVSKLGDLLGRKWVIILSGLVWVLGSVLQCAAHHTAMLVVGRVIGGSEVRFSLSC